MSQHPKIPNQSSSWNICLADDASQTCSSNYLMNFLPIYSHFPLSALIKHHQMLALRGMCNTDQ